MWVGWIGFLLLERLHQMLINIVSEGVCVCTCLCKGEGGGGGEGCAWVGRWESSVKGWTDVVLDSSKNLVVTALFYKSIAVWLMSFSVSISIRYMVCVHVIPAGVYRDGLCAAVDRHGDRSVGHHGVRGSDGVHLRTERHGCGRNDDAPCQFHMLAFRGIW